jgi:hypothetical protein
MLGDIRGTTSSGGLVVNTTLLEGEYLTSRTVTKKELDRLQLHPHTVCPNWNYTIEPTTLSIT